MRVRQRRGAGFSLLEMLVVIAIFALITGMVFQLLDMAQQRNRMESAVLEQFQGGRLTMDQLVRDIHASGYPPRNQFVPAVANNPASIQWAFPFGWSAGYPALPPAVGCSLSPIPPGIGGTCAAPTQWDLIIEADVDPQNADGIEWIRYRLNGTILERGEATKTPGADPVAATAGQMVPYLENVMNNASVVEMTRIRSFYPTMFPANTPVPLFNYICQTAPTATPAPCTTANNPNQIREVNIAIVARAENDDPRTRQPRVITLTGRARRWNPAP